MAFTKLSDYSYISLSSDSKITAGVNIGAQLVEYDTDARWWFDGTAWREVNDFLLDAAAAIQVATEATLAAIKAADALELAKGNIPGHSTVNKFGRNTDIDSTVLADIWDGGKTTGALPAGTSLIWVAPTAAAKHNLTSTSGSDASGGVGARTVKVYGLTDWDTAEVSETVVMDGTNDVETANAYVIIHRMEVMTKGATNVNVGTITATAKAPSATTVTARIEVGQGQTQMAIYGIPSVQVAYLNNWYASANKAGGNAGLVDLSLLVNPEPETELLNFLVKHTFGLQTVGSSAFPNAYVPPKIITGPAIIKVQALSGTANMDISAGFDLVLVDN